MKRQIFSYRVERTRLYIKGSIGPVDLQIGRQPISFGNGFVFSPLDLVQPFSFATIDNEYKPGIDAFDWMDT